MTEVIDQQSHLQHLCGHLGIDSSGDSLGNIHELMNFTLQCLGGIRLLFQKLESQRKSAMLKSLDDLSEWQGLGLQYWAIKKVFHDGVQRMLQNVLSLDEDFRIDPARHVIESFPNVNSIGKRHWMAAHWAILGDPMLHSYDVPVKSTTSFLNGKIDFKGEFDERIVAVNQLAKIIPESFTETDKEGRSVLHIAARLDSVPLFECALESAKLNNGAKISDINNNGALPLHNTARFSKSLPLLQRVEREFPEAVRAVNHEGLLPLHWAAVKNRNPEIVRYLLKAFPGGITMPNSEGYLPLHCAGQNDCLEVVQTVYEAFPEAAGIEDSDGGLPLHHACCFTRNVEVVKLVYNANPAAIYHPQNDGVTPIHLAASQNDTPQLLRFLLSVFPRAASLRDNEGWVALRVVAEGLKSRISNRRLQCFRILLHATPPDSAQIDIEDANFISRLSLNAFPSLNPSLYRELNWMARKNALLLVLQFARVPIDVGGYHDEQGTNLALSTFRSQSNQSGTLSFEQQLGFNSLLQAERALVLLRLCRGFISSDSFEVPAGVLRKILKFI